MGVEAAAAGRRRGLGAHPGELGEAKVADQDAAVARDHHVVRLDVAVDQPGGVCRGHAPTRGQKDVQRLAPGPRRLQPVAQRLALDELHGAEQTVSVGAELVDADDVRMVHAGHRLGLAPQPGLSLVVKPAEIA